MRARPRPLRARAGPAAAARALERLGDAVLACDRDGRLVVANRAARELHRLPAPPLERERWTAAAAVEDLAGRTLAPGELPLLRALGGERVHDLEVVVRAPDGTARVLCAEATPLRSRSHRVTGAVASLRDVTARHRRDEELRLRAAMLDHLAQPVALIRASDGLILQVDDAWSELFGYPPGELAGLHVSVLGGPGDRAPDRQAAEMVEALARDGRWRGELRHVRRDGTPLWCEAQVSSFEHPRLGTVWLAAHTDVTDQRDRERALGEAEERFRRIFEDGPVGIALVGEDLRLVDGNPALCDLLAAPREALTGRPLGDLSHPDDLAADARLTARLLRGEIPRYRVTRRLQADDGRAVLARVGASVLRAADGRVLCLVVVVDPLDDPLAARPSHDGDAPAREGERRA